MTYIINRPITGIDSVTPDNGISAPEFLALIDNVFAVSKGRVEAVEFDVDYDDAFDFGVIFKNAPEQSSVNFVYPARETVTRDARHLRLDLFQFNEGYDHRNSKVQRRKRDGSYFYEYVPGSRTFVSAHGWDLRPIHNAIRDLDLKANNFAGLHRENFPELDCFTVRATREGFEVISA